MSRGINKAIIVGNLGDAPESRAMPSGEMVSNFTVATSESWKDKQTGQPVERTEWHRISVFGRLAEICNQYLQKGSKVYIEGQIKTRKWKDQSGADRYTTEIVAREMQMLDSKGANSQQPAQAQQPPAQQPSHGGRTVDDFDDDIPF